MFYSGCRFCFDILFVLMYNSFTFTEGGKGMEKFIPYEKLSKKKQKELDRKRRKTWNGLNPVTRKPSNPKAYNRKKARKRMDYPDTVPFVFV